MIQWLPIAFLSSSLSAHTAEVNVVEYLKTHVKPGQPVVVSDLVNDVFKTPEERAALGRLFDAFFKVPLFAAETERASNRPPTLAEIADRFHLTIPGEARLLLDILDADPRVPRFLTRDPKSGEIVKADTDAIFAHPKFGKAVDRAVSGFEERPAPPFRLPALGGTSFDSSALAGRPHILYFWFTGCPPCVKTAPLLAAVQESHAKQGLQVIAINADKVLELPYADAEHEAYAKRAGLPFTWLEATPAVIESYGAVSVFPTLFFVDRGGSIVKQLVNFHGEDELEQAAALALR
jgi:thiol-disulfide isomerase/thioredoxin